MLTDISPALPIVDHVALKEALAAGHLPTLLMVHVHLTGDEVWLDRFAPYIRPPFFGGIAVPADLAQELRDRLFARLTDRAAVIPPAELPPALTLKMMSTCVGEPVAEEFLPMLAEQMGFKLAAWAPRAIPSGFKVLVIGTGMAGLCDAIMLSRAGYDFEIFEKHGEIGGTWLVNVYPGVGVDTPSHFYSYSFDQNPDWKNYYPKGDDMQAYLLHIVAKHDLRKKIKFGTEVVSCIWDPHETLWKVTARSTDGRLSTHAFNAIVSANGFVDRPAYPKLKGIETFKGPMPHTARWDPALDLTGKRVAVIGTGASAAQLCPAIADKVAHLTIFQRSKHWIIPNPDYHIMVPEAEKWAMRHVPYYAQWFRFTAFWWASDGLYPNVKKDPTWVSDTSVSARNEEIRQFALGYLREQLDSRPDLIEKVTPDFPIFSKRIILDPGWFTMLKRDNVALETNVIDHVTADSVVTADGIEHKVDVIILATGFEIQRMLAPMHIVGRDGVVLRERWGDDEAEAYQGTVIPGFPNFFVTPGPNSAPNHAGGMNILIEIQAKYIVNCLNMMLDRDARTFDVRAEANAAWNEKVQAELQTMIWTHPRARSYYRNSKGRVTVSCPYRLVDFWTMLSEMTPDDFMLDPLRQQRHNKAAG